MLLHVAKLRHVRESTAVVARYWKSKAERLARTDAMRANGGGMREWENEGMGEA